MNFLYEPEVVQVVPQDDYTVYVYFADGKIVCYDAKPLLDKGVFRALAEGTRFWDACCIINDTLAWDLSGDGDPTQCLDIAPDTLYALPAVEDILLRA